MLKFIVIASLMTMAVAQFPGHNLVQLPVQRNLGIVHVPNYVGGNIHGAPLLRDFGGTLNGHLGLNAVPVSNSHSGLGFHSGLLNAELYGHKRGINIASPGGFYSYPNGVGFIPFGGAASSGEILYGLNEYFPGSSLGYLSSAFGRELRPVTGDTLSYTNRFPVLTNIVPTVAVQSVEHSKGLTQQLLGNSGTDLSPGVIRVSNVVPISDSNIKSTKISHEGLEEGASSNGFTKGHFGESKQNIIVDADKNFIHNSDKSSTLVGSTELTGQTSSDKGDEVVIFVINGDSNGSLRPDGTRNVDDDDIIVIGGSDASGENSRNSSSKDATDSNISSVKTGDSVNSITKLKMVTSAFDNNGPLSLKGASNNFAPAEVSRVPLSGSVSPTPIFGSPSLSRGSMRFLPNPSFYRSFKSDNTGSSSFGKAPAIDAGKSSLLIKRY